MKFCVIGFPIGHSMSPFIHKELFKIKNITAEYGICELSADKLSSFVKSELCGFNVTIPHKVNIIKHLDIIDESAEAYGAVNTVHKRSDGKLYGYNTDAYGFLKGLEFSGISLSGKAVVYGYGGAARTIITECLNSGCEVIVATTKERIQKAKEVALAISQKTDKKVYVADAEELKGEYDLLINASPVGMYPNNTVSPLKEGQVSCFKAVYDIVYNPEKTELIKISEKLSKPFGTGMSMLVYQATKAHEIWYNAEFSRQEIEKVIVSATAKMNEVFGR